MSRILVSGSLAYDRNMDFPGLFQEHIIPEKTHSINVSFFVNTVRESSGGTAGNIAYNLGLLGETPVIVATAGSDFGPCGSWLTAHGADISLVQKIPGEKTAFATIITDEKNNQITAFYAGAMKTPYRFQDVMLEDMDFALIGAGNPIDMRTLPEILRALKIPFIFDPGQQIPALSSDDIKNGINGSRVFIVNDYELALIEKKTLWNETEIVKHTDILVVTKGGDGSEIKTQKETLGVPAAKPAQVSDPTGAGDAYRAGFIVGLSKNWPLETCGKFAGVVACYTIETYGTQTHMFTGVDLKKRYKENFGEELPL